MLYVAQQPETTATDMFLSEIWNDIAIKNVFKGKTGPVPRILDNRESTVYKATDNVRSVDLRVE